MSSLLNMSFSPTFHYFLILMKVISLSYTVFVRTYKLFLKYNKESQHLYSVSDFKRHGLIVLTFKIILLVSKINLLRLFIQK